MLNLKSVLPVSQSHCLHKTTTFWQVFTSLGTLLSLQGIRIRVTNLHLMLQDNRYLSKLCCCGHRHAPAACGQMQSSCIIFPKSWPHLWKCLPVLYRLSAEQKGRRDCSRKRSLSGFERPISHRECLRCVSTTLEADLVLTDVARCLAKYCCLSVYAQDKLP